jgi:hypothetical protein
MYARLLFVVVGILRAVLFRAVLAGLLSSPDVLPTGFLALRLGIAGGCGYTLAA